MESKPIKVLLIEDNLAHARAIGEGLCANLHHRFDLMCADRMSVGLEILARGGIDLLLLDLNLPDSAGLTTFDRFHRAAPQVPIVIMTGLDDPTLGQHAVSAGAKDVLMKGQIEPTLLARVIQHTVDKSRFEQAARNAPRGYGSLFENAREAMILVDDRARCLAVNAAACDLFGRSLQQLKGRPFSEFLMVNEDWGRRWQEWVDDGLKDGQAQFVRYDGTVGDLEYSVSPQCIATHHLVVFRDVSSRVRTRETLRATAEQWRTLANQFQAATAGHERIHARVASDLNAMVEQAITGHLQPTEMASRLQAIAAALLPASDSTLPLRLDPWEALRTQTLEFERRTGIQCRWTSKLRTRQTETDSAAKLCPILELALTNLAKHSDATNVKVRVMREEDRLVLEVEDNGPGVTEAQLTDPRAFRLAGVREQVLRFGGDFLLQGTPGKGTKLRVWVPSLPVAEADPLSAKAA